MKIVILCDKMSSDISLERKLRMKDYLHQLLDQCLEQGTEKDISALVHALEGIQKKVKKPKLQYIDGLLHMERKMDKEKKTCEITIPLNPLLDNSLNIVHGGITATVLDSVMGTVANMILPEGHGAVTNQLNIHYIAPGIGEHMRCTAELIHQGSKTVVVTGEAYRSDGKKIAHATGTFFIIQK